MPASNVIEIVVKVVDQATRGLAAVQSKIKTLDASVQKMLPSLSKTAKNLLAFAGVTGGIYAVGMAFRKMMTAIEGDEAATAQLEAGIKSTGGVAGYTVEQLREMAAEFQNVTRYGDEAINQMQSVLLTFTQIRGDQFKEATLQVANLASRLKVDLQAAALQVGKALNDPVLGVSMLSRAGIQFTATQKKMIKSLVEANKFVEAQKIVLAELETQFGGSAEAARNTLGGALEAVKNRFADLFEASKGTVQPATKAMNELEQTLASPGMRDGFQALISAMLTAVGWAAQLAGFVGNLITGLQVLNGSTGNAVENLRVEIDRIEKAMEKAAPGSIWRKLLFKSEEEADAFFKKLKERRDELAANQMAIIEGTDTPSDKPTPTDIAPRLQPDVEDRITKAIGATRTSFEKQREAILASRKELESFVNQYKEFDKETRDKAGVSEEMFAGAQIALGKLDQQLADLNKMEVLQEVGVSAKRVFDGISEQTKQWNNDTKTQLEKSIDEWDEFVFKLDTLLTRHAITPAQYAARYNEALKNSIEEVKVSSSRIKIELNQLSTAGQRAAENIQDAFANFFENMDGGFKGLAKSIGDVIKKTLANLAAAKVVKLLDIEGIIRKIEAPFKAAAKQAAKDWFEKVSIGGPPEKGKTPTAETGERAKKQVEAWEISKRKVDDATKVAIEKQTGDLEEVIVQSNAKITEAVLKQDPCACVRELGKTITAAIESCCAKVGDVAQMPTIDIPEIKAPEVNIPDIVVPEIKAPEVTVPEIVMPDIAVPEVNIPEIVVPEIASPEVTIPEIVMPEVIVPDIAVPDIVMPDIAMPEVNVPEIVVPEIAMPEIVMPEITMPDVNIPEIVVPPIDVPPAEVTVNVDMDAVLAAMEKVASVTIDTNAATVDAINKNTEAIEIASAAARSSADRTVAEIGKISQTFIDTTQTLLRGIESVMNRTIGNLSKIVVAIVKYAVDAIKKRKGGGTNWFEVAARLIVSYYTGGAGGSKGGYPAGFAKGGLIPAMAGGGLVRVGEEGPELVKLPAGSEVINRRQQSYRRMDQPQQIHYSPNYNIVIENAGDAKETREQLSMMLAARDRRLKSELVGMLKDNGFGRMR